MQARTPPDLAEGHEAVEKAGLAICLDGDRLLFECQPVCLGTETGGLLQADSCSPFRRRADDTFDGKEMGDQCLKAISCCYRIRIFSLQCEAWRQGSP